ncbi:MAG: hypothetical protein ABL874_02725 [Sphingopyxis sp.]
MAGHGVERVDRDPLAHLPDFSLRGLALGAGLAICSVATQILIFAIWSWLTSILIAAPPDRTDFPPITLSLEEPTFLEQVLGVLWLLGWLYLLILLHTLFIAAIATRLLDGTKSIFRHLYSRDAIVNGAMLALCFLPFVLLDIFSSSYGCADGKAYDVSVIPMLPWLWIGWLILNATGITARLGVPRIYQGNRRDTIYDRLFAIVPFAIPVLLFGYTFQIRSIDCTPPFDGFGFFEGGIVLFPLLGAFWFFMSVSSAIIAAICAAPPLVLSPASGKEA